MDIEGIGLEADIGIEGIGLEADMGAEGIGLDMEDMGAEGIGLEVDIGPPENRPDPPPKASVLRPWGGTGGVAPYRLAPVTPDGPAPGRGKTE